MKEGQALWTREELVIVINLYYTIPFGRMHRNTPEVLKVAALIGRTPGSVAYKLVNFASLDPSLQARGIRGASNVSKLDKQIWSEFYNNLNELAFESELLLAIRENKTIEQSIDFDENELFGEGKTREAVVRIRVNQSFFRKSVLAAYNNTCCITGLNIPELLVSGHIVPWSVDEKNRLNPWNGLALNALHDKAFENGLITITPDYRIRVSSSLRVLKDSKSNEMLFGQYDGKEILLPSKFRPDPEFLRIHNKRFVDR
jgi:putative restriction endonuclease